MYFLQINQKAYWRTYRLYGLWKCVIVFSIGGDQIEIQHLDKDKFPTQILGLEEQQPQFVNNYIKFIWAGYQAGFQGIKQGFKALVSGNVPLESGLSSSAALTVASAKLTLQVQGSQDVNLLEFIQKIIYFERKAGTACGGMDQTISVIGKEGCAQYITFNPIQSQEVQLPKGYSFIIANSLTPSPKLETLGKRYNKRVCECLIGIRLITQGHIDQQFKTLRELQQHLNYDHNQLFELAQRIPKGEIPIKDLEHLDLVQLLSDVPYSDIVLSTNESFNPYNRIIHVIQESQRVLQFVEVCQSNDPDDQKAIKLGKLMNESQDSCRDLYECSSEQIDILTKLARQNGALGSRLTGAGWGGGTVSLVPEQLANDFIHIVILNYYKIVS
ncbi:hypothetical protein pb186bvf_011592 [Paramecium bursaria]